MKIENILSRLDEEAFQNILGQEVISTLKAVDENYLSAKSLLLILSNSYSNTELLKKQVSRNLIIDSLTLTEIQELAAFIGQSPATNLYENIKRLNFSGSNLIVLFDFFELPIPEQDEIEWIQTKDIEPHYPLYTYQRTVLKKIDQYLCSSQNRVLLHMPTGSGKTRTAMSYICRYLVENHTTNVVWFANTKELLEQAYSEFIKAWSFLGDRTIHSVKYWGQSNIDLTQLKGSFIVAGLDKTYQALMRSVGSMSIFANNCSLVIMDEAHMAIAPTYKLLIENMIVNKASLIGLSATPGRTWNDPEEDKKLSSFFFKQKAKLEIDGYENPVDYLVEKGYLAKVKNTPLFSSAGIKLSTKDMEYLKEHYILPDRILEQISESQTRNMIIVSKFKELIKVHKRIILFAITRRHAIVLNSLLTAIGITSRVITSETPLIDRTRIIENFKISREENPEPLVLCNFGILTTGFDAPETSCAVIARPTDSLVLYSQMVGRAIRGIRSGGNTEAEIITVIDEDLPGFKEVADAFINWEDIWEN